MKNNLINLINSFKWKSIKSILLVDRLPNNAALKTLKALIKYGVSLGKISQDYHVIGHRQTKNTLCPGDKLYEYIQKFAQWTANPVPKNSTTSWSYKLLLDEWKYRWIMMKLNILQYIYTFI